MQKINREEAVSIIRELATRYLHEHGKPPRTIIVVGGTAMALRELRNESEDVDIFYPEDAFLSIAEDLEKQSGLRIDVTGKTNLWGQIKIQDIEQDAEVMESLEIEGFTVDIAAISPETLFVIKSSSMRNKDRDDLPLLAHVTTPQEIMARVGVLLKTVETRSVKEELLANILSEMQVVYLEVIRPEWFTQAPEFAHKYSAFIEEQFGICPIPDSVRSPEISG